MEPFEIVLIVLVIAAIWAVAELALTLRRTRGVANSLDETVSKLNNTIAEAQPIVAKLDGAVDELQPALAQVEPLLKSTNTAVDALTANLVEVESVVRDVSSVTGAAANAGSAVSGITDTATEAVQRFLGKKKAETPAADRVLTGTTDADESMNEGAVSADTSEEPSVTTEKKAYYTYASAEGEESDE